MKVDLGEKIGGPSKSSKAPDKYYPTLHIHDAHKLGITKAGQKVKMVVHGHVRSVEVTDHEKDGKKHHATIELHHAYSNHAGKTGDDVQDDIASAVEEANESPREKAAEYEE